MHAFGALLSFELARARGRASALDAAAACSRRVRVVTHAVSLGDVRTLIVHPASTTHSTMPPEARVAADIADGLLRLSVGIEATAISSRDLEQALGTEFRAVSGGSAARADFASTRSCRRRCPVLTVSAPWIASSSSARGSTT